MGFIFFNRGEIDMVITEKLKDIYDLRKAEKILTKENILEPNQSSRIFDKIRTIKNKEMEGRHGLD